MCAPALRGNHGVRHATYLPQSARSGATRGSVCRCTHARARAAIMRAATCTPAPVRSSHLAARTGRAAVAAGQYSATFTNACTERTAHWRRHEQAAWRTSCARLCRSTLSACARKGSSLSLQMRWILVISMNDQSEIGSKSQRRNMANRRCGTSAQQAGSCGLPRKSPPRPSLRRITPLSGHAELG